MTPFEVAQAGFWLTLQNAVVSVVMFTVLVFVLLRIANKLSGIKFTETFSTMSPRDQGIYLSVRYASLSLSAALIIAASFLYA